MSEQDNKTIREVSLTLPVSPGDLDSLELGDAVFLNGLVFTGREGVYSQIFEKKINPPIDLRKLGGATFHCSPAINETSPGVIEIAAADPARSEVFINFRVALVSVVMSVSIASMPPISPRNVYSDSLPNFWSLNLLWNQPTLTGSIRDIQRKYGIKVLTEF